jgi:glycosyltransferase involved in cell wall biosynthesis
MNEALPASNVAARHRERAPAVLQVLPSLEAGGVERGTCDVANALVQAGWRSFVASAGGPMTRELERAKARHAELPVDSKNPFVMRKNIERISRLIESYHIDIVHARSRAPAWSARAAARRTGRPFVTTFHGTYGHGSALKRRYNAVMASGDRVIAISDFIAGHVREVYDIDEARLVTIPRGINLKRFDPAAVSGERMIRLARAWRLPDGVPVIMLPGRLSRWKGQMVLVDALAELRIQTKGLGSVVAVIDDCDDMAAAYKLADVVVSASTDPEAFGRVAAEAQAMGRPVIATDHGGARETVIHGETGWLVPPGDVSALSKTIKAALALDVATREAVAVAARDHIEARYSVEAMCQATLEVYEALLDTR